jgi:hypothetical protein
MDELPSHGKTEVLGDGTLHFVAALWPVEIWGLGRDLEASLGDTGASSLSIGIDPGIY